MIILQSYYACSSRSNLCHIDIGAWEAIESCKSGIHVDAMLKPIISSARLVPKHHKHTESSTEPSAESSASTFSFCVMSSRNDSSFSVPLVVARDVGPEATVGACRSSILRPMRTMFYRVLCTFDKVSKATTGTHVVCGAATHIGLRQRFPTQSAALAVAKQPSPIFGPQHATETRLCGAVMPKDIPESQLN